MFCAFEIYRHGKLCSLTRIVTILYYQRGNYRRVCLLELNANRKSEVPCGVAENTIQFVMYDDLFGGVSALYSRQIISRGFVSQLNQRLYSIATRKSKWYFFYFTHLYSAEEKKKGPSLHHSTWNVAPWRTVIWIWATDRVIAEIRTDPKAQ